MAIEILVLSGARQGERLRIDSDRFRVGGAAGCEVFFDPTLDAGAKSRVALLQSSEDGWTLLSESAGEVLVNNSTVVGLTRIRSGDVIRLSRQGPDFSFNFASRSAHLVSAAGFQGAGLSSAVEETSSSVDPGPKWLITACGAGVLVIVFVLGLVFSLNRSSQEMRQGTTNSAPIADVPLEQQPTVVENSTQATKIKKPPSVDPPSQKVSLTEEDGLPESSPQAVAMADAPPKKARARNPWANVEKRARQSAYLLAVEQPTTKSIWPLATGCAIKGQRLLTSGSVILELAKFQQQGWGLIALDSTRTLKLPIISLKVHVGFVKAKGEPETQIYFDLGLAGLAQEPGSTLPLASHEELSELESGLELNCVGIVHESEALTRFSDVAADCFPAKVFIITSLPPQPGPRLLHFKADLPSKPFGAPLVSASGKVCAVYAESAYSESKKGPDLKLHYAPIADPQIIEAKDDEIWVSPPIESPAKKP